MYLIVAAIMGVVARDSLTVRWDWGNCCRRCWSWRRSCGSRLSARVAFRGYNLQWAWLDIKSPECWPRSPASPSPCRFCSRPTSSNGWSPRFRSRLAVVGRIVLMLGYAAVGAPGRGRHPHRHGGVGVGAAFSFNLLTAVVLAPVPGSWPVGRVGGGVGAGSHVALCRLAGRGVWRICSGVVATATDRQGARCCAERRLSRSWRCPPETRSGGCRCGAARAQGPAAADSGDYRDQRHVRQRHLGLRGHNDQVTGSVLRPGTGRRGGAARRPGDRVRQRRATAALSFGEAAAEQVASVPGVASVSPSVNQEGVLILGPAQRRDGRRVGIPSGPRGPRPSCPRARADLLDELPRGPGEVALDATTAERLAGPGIGFGSSPRWSRMPPRSGRSLGPSTSVWREGDGAVFDLPTAQRFITGVGQVNQLLVSTSEEPARVAASINEAPAPSRA